MRKHITILFVFLFLGIAPQIATAQNENASDYSKNVIHVSLGSFLFVNSAQLTYDRLLLKKERGFFKSYYLTFKGGRQIGIDSSGNNAATGHVLGAQITALTGTAKNHFEIGLGLGYFIDKVNTEDPLDEISDSDESTLYPSISIGYRKQTEEGFMFRTGVGISEWAYIGFGYSF